MTIILGVKLRVVLLFLGVAPSTCVLVSAQEVDLKRFQADLSSALLGNSTPISDGGTSHLGIAVVAPGEAWSLGETEENFLDRTPWGTSQLAIQFNYPVEVNGGIATVRRQQRLEKLWQRVLSGSVPEAQIPPDLSNSVLFRTTDRVDAARGLDGLRHASEKYLRYQEFKAAWQVLELSDDASGAWRFHPRFSTFSSLDEARSNLADDWVRFGYRVEVEAAIQRFHNELARNGWSCWLSGNTSFAANTIEVIPGVPSGRTMLFPREAEWYESRSWSTVSFKTAQGTEITCQLFRVKILRPWLEWTIILDPQFRLTKASDLGVVSDGAVPTNDLFAKGLMANFVEELVLVRRIAGPAGRSGHPLFRFEASKTDVPQLIAFVVRSLPRIAPGER